MFASPRIQFVLALGVAICLQSGLASWPITAQSANRQAGCKSAAPAKPATPMAKGPNSGTKNMGSTGWSGGSLGGSHNDYDGRWPDAGLEDRASSDCAGTGPDEA